MRWGSSVRLWSWLGVGWMVLLALVGGGCRGAATTPAPLPPPALHRVTMTPTATATPTPTPPCWQGRAEPRATTTPIPAGEAFPLAWDLTNEGGCAWPADTQLEGRVQGAVLFRQPLGQELAPQASRTWRVEGIVLQIPGTYTVTLHAFSPEGTPIPWSNDPSVELNVFAPTPTPTPTATPGAPVFQTGVITVDPGDVINFDDEGPDFLYDGDEIIHYPLYNHIAVFGYLWPLDIADCYNFPYGRRNAVQNPQQYVGATFCYTTDQARVGMFRLEDAVPTENGWRLVIRYVTWAAKRPRP